MIRLHYWLLPMEGKKNIPTVTLDNKTLTDFAYDIDIKKESCLADI